MNKNMRFYMIGAAHTNEGDLVFGIAYNLHVAVEWVYDFNQDTVEVEVITGFFNLTAMKDTIKVFIEQNLNEIEEGHFNFCENRKEEAIEILTSALEMKESYVGVKV